MTLIIVTILIVGYCLIATEKFTNVNKAAVAIFVGTLGWMLYIGNGRDYVMSMHLSDFMSFVDGGVPTSDIVKQFIAQNIFLKYVGKASEVVLFLLATMTIVEILQNNGCFDFIPQLMRTRSSRKILWVMSAVTFAISANLDNLTTTVMMLMIMRGIVRSRRQRVLLGCAIVLSANCGGALTVIGDPVGLVLWNTGAVTASNFSMALILPCLLAWALPLWWLGLLLPERADLEWITMPYRGDDTNLNVWQRLLMLFVGIGGLWFVPTFHNITKLSPFIGALCVAALLWIVNEIVNRKLMNNDDMIQRRVPRVLQYGVVQMIFFVLGIMLASGVIHETGIARNVSNFVSSNVGCIWLSGVVVGALSMFLDSFASAMTMISTVDLDTLRSTTNPEYLSAFAQNGEYWKVVAYASAVGGNIMSIGSTSGLALMKMERVRISWYFRNVGWMAAIGAVAGFIALLIIVN